MDFRADLHCHTNCSDGTLTPEGLVRHAAEVGLRGLAITDHDTLEAYESAVSVADEIGLDLISGIELSSMMDRMSVHVLGYAFSLKSDLLHDYCKRHVQWRRERNLEILERLTAKGYPVTEEEVVHLSGERGDPGEKVYGRPHIAMALVTKGFVVDVRDAFNRLIGDRSPCYSPGNHSPVEEAIDVIQRSGGFAVIAHPHLIARGEAMDRLLALPFDGIEGYYARFPKEMEGKWVAIGRKKEWIVTGGSDFHGAVKPSNPLGASWVGKEVFDVLKQRYRRENGLSNAP